jgi:hypothetical protein
VQNGDRVIAPAPRGYLGSAVECTYLGRGPDDKDRLRRGLTSLVRRGRVRYDDDSEKLWPLEHIKPVED